MTLQELSDSLLQFLASGADPSTKVVVNASEDERMADRVFIALSEEDENLPYCQADAVYDSFPNWQGEKFPLLYLCGER